MTRLNGLVLTVWLGFSASLLAQDKLTLVLDAGGHTANVWKVLFSPDGKQLYTVSEDKTLRVWDVSTGEPLNTVRSPLGEGDLGALRAAALRGNRLALGGFTREDAIYLLSLSDLHLERTLRGHDNVVFALAFSPDGKRLASGSADCTARVWDADTGRCLLTLTGHDNRIMDVAFSPDGRRLATASYDHTARVWAADTGKLAAELKGHTGELHAVAWSPDGKTLATGGKDQSIRLWDVTDGFRLTRRFDRLRGSSVTSVTFTPDGKALLVTRGTGGSHACELLDLTTGNPKVRFHRHNNTVFHGAISPDGLLAATTGGHDNETYLWRLTDGSVSKHLAARSRNPWSAAWGLKGDLIVWGDDPDQRLERAFDLAALELAPVGEGPYRRAATTHGGQPVVVRRSGESRLSVRVGKQAAFTIDLEEHEVHTAYTLLGENQLALGTNFGLSLFDLRTGRRLHTFSGANQVWALAPSPDGRYLLSASADQVLRIWRLARAEPFLSLFVAGNDWVAWTPEGYYAASPGGERLMGWQQDNGPNRLGTFLPAERFRASRYRPEVVKRLLVTGSVDKALAAVRPEPGGVAALSEALPPVVVLTAPDRARVEIKEPALEVRFVARPVGKHPIKAVRLLLDGRPYPAAARAFDPPRAGEVRESWTIQVAPGKHSVAVVVETAVSKGTSEPVEVFFGGRGMIRADDPPDEVRKALQPALYVLAVGVSDYSDEAMKLRYAAKDATVLAQTYKDHSKGLYKKVEVRLITNKEATRKNILAGLTWLRKQMTQNDVAVIFFAGHGDKDADGKFYLLPVDVDKDDLLASAVPGELVKGTLAGFPGRCLLMLDACHAGAVDGERRRGATSLTDDLARDLATDDFGVIVMCSAMGREFALESPKVEHGYFTLALVEGLSGKANRTAEGAVYLHHLDAYVTDRVKELSGGKQHPVTVKPGSVRSFPLTKP